MISRVVWMWLNVTIEIINLAHLKSVDDQLHPHLIIV